MRITPRPPADVSPVLALERERTRRILVYARLGLLGLVVLCLVGCIAVGRLSVTEAEGLGLMLISLITLASRPLRLLFAAGRGSRR
jgi:hypothetical protein